jgi:hypothetical protein
MIVLPAELRDWSLPLAVAGGLLAGIALVIPMARRRRTDEAPSFVEERRAPLTVESGAAPAASWSGADTGSGASRTIGSTGTLSEWRTGPITSLTAQDEPRMAVASTRARLNGSPVPYLTPVPDRTGPHTTPGTASSGQSRVVSTNVEGLAWTEHHADETARRLRA